jgi:hypothetical protein
LRSAWCRPPIGNAADATGLRLRRVPFTLEKA